MGLELPALLIDGTFQAGFGVNGAVWFVSAILGFYLLFPLIAKPYFRHPLIGLALAAAISIGWKLAADHMTGSFQALEGDHADAFLTQLNVVPQLPGWAFSFGVGMTAAWIYSRLTQSGPASSSSGSPFGPRPWPWRPWRCRSSCSGTRRAASTCSPPRWRAPPP